MDVFSVDTSSKLMGYQFGLAGHGWLLVDTSRTWMGIGGLQQNMDGLYVGSSRAWMGYKWALADYRWVFSGHWQSMAGLSVDTNRTRLSVGTSRIRMDYQ